VLVSGSAILWARLKARCWTAFDFEKDRVIKNPTNK